MMLVRTRVAPSAIHGMGLFASQFIPRGTPIWRFEEGFDRDFSPARVQGMPVAARDHIRWFSFFRKEDGHAVLSGDHACFMNHSVQPNTGMPRENLQGETTVALRDIAEGEEITCNYFEFDADASGKLRENPVAH